MLIIYCIKMANGMINEHENVDDDIYNDDM